MPAASGMTELQVRKRLLVLQSDLHRTLIRAEGANLRAQLKWVREAGQKANALQPWLKLGAAAVGLLAVWRGRKLARWAPVALAVLKWARRIKK